MIQLLSAMAIFIGSHLVLSSGPVRRPLVRMMGEGAFSAGYSLVAVVLIVRTVIAFESAPREPLWSIAWLWLVPIVAMPVALLFLVCGLSQPNPTAVGAQFGAATDPAPGILRVTRHPVLWSFALWALAHVAPNGDPASLVFFGGFALLALGGMVIIDAKRRARDPEGYVRFAAATSRIPFLALATGRARPDWHGIGWRRLGAAALLYVALLVAHPLYTGMPILPLR
jgi:uncharacterized membrane protein